MSTEQPDSGANKPLRIGHYDVVKHIATGGMGAVYKAVDIDLDREVAIKVLTPEIASKPGMLERFKLEATIAGKLRHENIVTVYEFGQSPDGMRYLVMEYVEGIDLSAYIHRKGKLAPEEARYFLVQAVKALEQLHRQGLVHRDIKPSNFLLTKSGGKPTLKLTDLGLARQVSDEEFKLTRTGTTVGTVDYMAPEQAKDSRSADIRSDIYSLGCTWFHMLTGRAPFDEGGLTERLYKHIQEEPPDVRKFNDKVPEATVAILRRMLEKKPEARYQTPADLLKDLLSPKRGGGEINSRDVLETLAKLEPGGGEGPGDSGARSGTSRSVTVPNRPVKMRRDAPGIRRRARANQTREQGQPFLVIQGWQAWTAVGVLALIIGGIVYALSIQGGSRRPATGKGAVLAKAPEGDNPATDQATPPAEEPPPEPKPKARNEVPLEKISNPPKSGSNEKAAPPPPPPPAKTAPAPALPEAPPVYQPPPQVVSTLQQEQQQPQTFRSTSDKETFRATIREYIEDVKQLNDARNREVTELLTRFENEQQKSPTGGMETLNKLKDELRARQKKTKDPRLMLLADALSEISGQAPPEKPRVLKTTPTPGTKTGTPEPPPDDPADPAPAAESRATAPHVIVTRNATGNDGLRFTTLTAALANARADGETIVEIQDNGPLFVGPVVLKGKSILLRAGKGFRPVLAWDTQHPGYAKAESLFTVGQANLTLENLDLVLKRTESIAPNLGSFVKVTDGALQASHCTFSVAGTDARAAPALQLDGASTQERPVRCLLHRCFVRGADLIALDVRSPGAEIRIDGSLMVNAARPLIQFQGAAAVPTQIKLLRSTLVSGQTLLHARPATAGDRSPAIKVLVWDSLLAFSGHQRTGELLGLGTDSEVKNLQWRSVNSICTGWPALLAFGTSRLSDEPVWRATLQHKEGDKILPDPWPNEPIGDASDRSPLTFLTQGTPLYHSATSVAGPLGCNVALLPRGRENWSVWTYDIPTPPPIEPPSVAAVPDLLQTLPEQYNGEMLDLERLPDLGQHLENMLRKYKQFGPRVVLHLTGRGEKKTGPIKIEKGTSLILYFVPQFQDGFETPLTLVPRDSSAGGKQALIDVAGGNLEIYNGCFRLPNFSAAAVPAYILQVKGGDLLLANCHLQGPLGKMPEPFRALINFDETPAGTPLGSLPRCAITDSVLVSGRACINNARSGGLLRIQQSVLIAGTDAIQMGLGDTTRARLNTACVLEHNTFAVKRTVLDMGDAGALQSVPIEPVIVQAKENQYLFPFVPGTTPAAILRFEDKALSRGVLSWRGEKNLCDRRMLLCSGPSTWPLPDSKQPRFGGSVDEHDLQVIDLNFRKLELDQLERADKRLDRTLLATALTLPTNVKPKGTEPLAGADLMQLRIGMKATRPTR